MSDKMNELIKTSFNKTGVHTDDLPSIDLYMDQVITLIEQCSQKNDRLPDEKPLTKMMVNNYSKAGLISPIRGKKYSREHIVQMLTIYALKGTLSIGEIKSVLDSLYAQEDFGSAELSGCYEKGLMMQDKARSELCSLLDGGDLLCDDNISDRFASLMAVCAMSDALSELARRMTMQYFGANGETKHRR